MRQIFDHTRTLAGVATLAAGLVFGGAALATDDRGHTQIGLLDCDVSGGLGLILGSKKSMTCVFTRNDGSTESYEGRITKIGIDIGKTKKAHLKWEVLAPSGDADVGALAGKYDGVGAEATVAGGIGANALFSIGNNLTLQPFSVQTQEGFNVAGGLEQVRLDYKP